MKNRTVYTFGLLALVLGVAGCASMGDYKKLEAQNQELASQNAALTKEKEALKMQSEQTKSAYQDIVTQLNQEVVNGELKISQYKNMLTVDLSEQLFFDSGSATLKKQGKQVLKKVGTLLAVYKDKLIWVAGHTDNVPLSPAYKNKYPTNWELSVLRATNVVHYLQQEANIPPERLIASGRSQYAPIASNATAEGRKLNRRIQITLLDKNMVEALQEQQ